MRTRRLRKRLHKKRQTELQDLVAHLLENPNANVADNLRRLETYTQVLAFLQPRVSREALVAVVVAVISLGLAGFLWAVRVPETRITLKVQSASVALRLAQPWSWRGHLPLDTRLVSLDALTTLASPELFSELTSTRGDIWLKLTGGKAALVALHVEHHGIVELDSRHETMLELYTRNAPLLGQMTVRGSARLQAGTSTADVKVDTQVDLEIPETVSFSAEGRGAVPARVRVYPQEPLVWHNISVRELRFGREMPSEAGDITFVPTITSGTLLMHDVSESVTLREGEPLSLTGIRGRLVELRVGHPFTLQFEGSVQKVQVGPPDAQGDLAPSLLRYYYH